MIVVKPVRVAVIGCGRIAQDVHLPAYMENPKSRLIGICDVNEDLLRRVGERFNVANLHVDYLELLESHMVDAVSICTPAATHSEIAVAAAENGIHVLCEKPLASNMEEGERIAKAVQENRIKFMVGFNYRFLPNHVMTKKFVDDGKIGKPILANGKVVAADPHGPSYRRKMALGILSELGSHLADLLIWMMGPPKEVYATFATTEENPSIDDSALVLIKFGSNALGSISLAWLNLPDYQAMANSRLIEIVGTKGKIESDFFGPSLYFYGADSITSKLKGKIKITPHKIDPRIPDEALRWSYRQEINHFLESVARNKHPLILAEDGMNALKLVTAAYDSAKRKSAMILD